MERQHKSKLIQHLGIIAGVCKEIRLVELSSKDFHDDSLGTALDKLYEHGITELFFSVASQILEPERVMALIMIMTLSLLVYSLSERRIRAALKEEGAHIWNQKNKPTDNPTARWVFTIFEDVLLLYTHSEKGITVQAMNLRAEHEIVINSLGEHYRKMFFL